MPINTVIFDLGGVLVDWNPRYLYDKLFEDKTRMEYFLNHICNPDWNEEQDAGRSLKEATETLVAKHPEWENEIRVFYGRWTEMLGGVFDGTVDILKRLQAANYKLYALTNWSAETFPEAIKRYEFLSWFENILVSGKEGIRKPYPKIYEMVLDRFQINPAMAVFTDDNHRNVLAARQSGIPTIHFQSPEQLEKDLQSMGLQF